MLCTIYYSCTGIVEYNILHTILDTYLIEGLVARITTHPVLSPFNIQPDPSRPLALAVGIKVVQQLAKLIISTITASGTYIYIQLM